MVVVELHKDDGVEWWLSFTSHNPGDGEYILCPNKEFAFGLEELIEKFCAMKNVPSLE